MSDDIAIKVESVSKTFKLPHEKNTSIKGAVVNFYKRNKSYEKQQVLKDISFEIKKGEFFGIVGRNGSGKSTLLKLLAGIYTPTTGGIQINGKLTPFIELGVGFNMELTGRENVYLNGALLGFNRDEMNIMYDEIVEFAELEKFMDQKLKNYSSGMQVRLAFSIAIRAKSDILLIDEVLAVGDTAFQRKCFEVFTQLRKDGRTIVFITHDMSAVERYCDKVLVLHQSKNTGIYNPSEATVEYDRLNVPHSDNEKSEKKSNRWGTGDVRVKEVSITQNTNDKPSQNPILETGKNMQVTLKLENKQKKNVVIGLAFEDMFGVNVSGPNSANTKLSAPSIVEYSIPKLALLPGKYKMTIALFDEELIEEYDHLEKHVTFTVTSPDHLLYGKVNLFGNWEQKN